MDAQRASPSPRAASAPRSAGTRPFTAIPQPPGAPLVGNLADWLGRAQAEDVLERLRRQAEEHGPLLRLRLGPANMLVIADAALASTALGDERANHKGLSYILTRAVLDNVLLLNGEAWRRHRALYRAALRGVDVRGPTRTLVADFCESLGRGREVDLAHAVPRLVCDVVSTFTCGEPFPRALDDARARIQYELAGLGIDLVAQPWTYASVGRWTSLRRAVDAVREHFHEVTVRRLRAGSTRPDILGGFMALHDEGELRGGARAIAEGVVNFFFTAHDVLATSAMWTLHLLARHPGEQRSHGETGLTHVLREGLRLYPGYALFGRTTQNAMQVGAHDVPRGTFLIVSPYVTHRLSRHFEDPLAFRPARWGRFGDAPIVSSPDDQYIPFGVGPRSCLANHLAVPIMRTIVGDLLEAFSLESARPEETPGIRYWGTALPSSPLPVRFERRA